MKTVVITGTSRGIGNALAKKFLEADYQVIGTSTSGKAGINHPNFEVVKLNLSDSVSIQEAVKKINKKFPKINILINNAGVNLENWNYIEVDLRLLRKTLEINLIGLIDFTERLLHSISPRAQIVNVSSRLGSLSERRGDVLDNPSYRISKTALNMYTKTLASRLKEKGIIVSSVHPGWVKTDMGGKDAPREPNKAAEEIFKLATTVHPTGLFWYDNKQLPW